MLKASDVQSSPVLMKYIEKQLSLLEEKDTGKSKKTCREMIDLVPAVIKQSGYEIVSAMPFKRLAIIYEKEGDFEKAINTCVLALSFNLDDDGTKGGIIGRIERLKKKAGL